MIRGSDGALGATVVEKLRQMVGDKLSHQARRRSESILRTRAALDIVEGLEEWQIGFSCTIGTGPEAHHPLWQQFSIHSQGLPSIQGVLLVLLPWVPRAVPPVQDLVGNLIVLFGAGTDTTSVAGPSVNTQRPLVCSLY